MENPNLTRPTYSIVLLIYHRTPELVEMAKECVSSINGSSEDYELIIVDNGSTVRFDWDKYCATYIRLDKNWGISHGWNMGLYAARGKYLVIVGDDVKVHKGWLEAMKEGMEQPDAGMCNPQIEHLPPGKGIVANYKWPSGACFMLSRETIAKVGYFDEDTYFPANHEDWDYWTRIYKAGLKIYTNYSITVQHKEGQTVHAKDISEQNSKTRQAFLFKWKFDPTPVFCGDAPMPFD